MSGPYAPSTTKIYEIFTFDSQHNLSDGISRLLKNCFYIYVSLDKLETYLSRPLTDKIFAFSLRTSIFPACNNFLDTV